MDFNDRVLDKLDKIDGRLTKIEITQGEMKVDLNHHIRRTELAEEAIALQREENEANKKDTNTRLIKLEKWSDKFHYLGWLLLGAISVLSKLDRIKSIFHSFF